MSFLLQTMVVEARSAPESFADLVEDVGSSVVNITTTTKVETPVVPRGVVVWQKKIDMAEPASYVAVCQKSSWCMQVNLADS